MKFCVHRECGLFSLLSLPSDVQVTCVVGPFCFSVWGMPNEKGCLTAGEGCCPSVVESCKIGSVKGVWNVFLSLLWSSCPSVIPLPSSRLSLKWDWSSPNGLKQRKRFGVAELRRFVMYKGCGGNPGSIYNIRGKEVFCGEVLNWELTVTTGRRKLYSHSFFIFWFIPSPFFPALSGSEHQNPKINFAWPEMNKNILC